MSPDTIHYLLQGIQNVTWQSLVPEDADALLPRPRPRQPDVAGD